MVLEDKLEIAMHGYNINNPSSVFAYIWNSVGIPVKEENVKDILGTITESRRTPQQADVERQEVEEVIQDIRSRLSADEIEPEFVKELLKQRGYEGHDLERLTDIVVDVLPHYSMVEPEGLAPPVEQSETDAAFKELEDVPELEKEPTEPHIFPGEKPIKLPFKALKAKRTRSFVPSEKAKRQAKVSSEFRPIFKAHRTMFKTPSEKRDERIQRAKEILKTKPRRGLF